MIEIVMLQCLLTDIKHCREVNIPVLEATTVERCQDVGVMKVNIVAKEYPTWFIRSWKCQHSETRKKAKQDI